MGWLEPGAMPFGAPLWLLAALCGTEAASEVGLEEVRGVATTRCRLIVNCSQAQERKRRSWIVTELWDFGTDAILVPGAADEL
jgi:hypothetical protein